MAAKLTDLGMYCRQEDIFEESLTGDNVLSKLSKPISKGIAYGLNAFRKKHEFSWDVLYEWLKQLSQEPLPQETVKLTVDEIAQNLVKLLTPLSSQSTTTQDQENEALIGKRIRHRWKDSDGSEEWYYGRILSLVPGTDNWFNVTYDGESIKLTLRCR